MLYLDNTGEAQAVYIPRSGAADGGLVFRARSTVDLTEFSVGTIDLGTSRLYYNVSVVLPEGIPDGEYEYTLLADGVPVSSGLLVIGEAAGAGEYNREIEYEQYET